ncbi:prephenate dehydrogenase [Cerasicoccus fimbriatus]|uniref:prephenate dehydrogenase n=1 Tax=Cerasicoccus fimbriatus TaxID=3014554 RepID=UPI0022B4F562|nr:prephenate dehydrogenase/arogenate dehydrogenase family protein [Cerasicoccus sp. TK19100]
MFQQATILAPGLLGASLLMALKERGLAKKTVAWARRAETRLQCQEQPWCDAVFPTANEAVRGSDLIVLCPPVEYIVPMLQDIAPDIAPGALVTDVGSTKSLICRQARAIGGDWTFVGSHPMTGSEKTGLENGCPDLFPGRACFVTPLTDTPENMVEKAVRLWRELGMEVATTSPEKHDEIVAHISHLPHLLASTLCSYLTTQDENWRNYGGGGLRDTTRVASGDPGMWKAIAMHNKEEIIRSLDGFDRELQRLRSALHNDQFFEVLNFLERAKDYRDRLRIK